MIQKYVDSIQKKIFATFLKVHVIEKLNVYDFCFKNVYNVKKMFV